MFRKWVQGGVWLAMFNEVITRLSSIHAHDWLSPNVNQFHLNCLFIYLNFLYLKVIHITMKTDLYFLIRDLYIIGLWLKYKMKFEKVLSLFCYIESTSVNIFLAQALIPL